MKQHRSFRLLATYAASMLVLGACSKDLLKPVPLNSLSDATAFSTADKLLAGINNLYAQLLNASYYGGRYIVFQEQRGDEFSQNDGNNSTGANVWNQTITSSGNFVNAVWTAAYKTINSANILLANLQETTVLSEELRKNYIGEAKFIRAFCYHSLVQTYAKPYLQDKAAPALPLRLSPETSGANNDVAFSTVEEVYTQIIKDLDEAEASLPASYATALLHVSRAKVSSAVALKTRVYLTMGNYDKVIAEAAKLVPAAAPYTFTAGSTAQGLESDILKVFSGTYTGTEAIFTLPIVNAAEAPGSQSAVAYNYLYPILYLNTAAIASNPVFAASSTDARYLLTRKNAAGQTMLTKFSRNTVPYNDYIPVIRYAEVLLNYAEAAANKDDLVKAPALLNAVRKRSDPGYGFPEGSVSTRAELIQTILTERRIELLGEGFRTVDLLRRVQTLPAKSGNAGTAPAVAPNALNYVWAVPSDELSYNTLAPR